MIWSCTSGVSRHKPHCLRMSLALTMRLASCMVGCCLLGFARQCSCGAAVPPVMACNFLLRESCLSYVHDSVFLLRSGQLAPMTTSSTFRTPSPNEGNLTSWDSEGELCTRGACYHNMAQPDLSSSGL